MNDESIRRRFPGFGCNWATTKAVNQAAVDYFTCFCPDIPEQHITATARLVGGHFVDLVTACEILTSCSDLKKIMFKGIKKSEIDAK